MRIHRRMQGFTLIECLMAMGMAVGLVGVLTFVMGRTISGSTAAREHLEDTNTLGRMAEQFRTDVANSTSAIIDRPQAREPRLQLVRGDGAKVSYQITNSGLDRTVSQGEQVRQRESFTLGRLKIIGWQQNDVTLAMSVGQLVHPRSEDPSLRGQFTIEAAPRSPGVLNATPDMP